MATHCSHQDVYKEARKVAVATILHTDNANHFAMIKDITQVYETYDSWLQEFVVPSSLEFGNC